MKFLPTLKHSLIDLSKIRKLVTGECEAVEYAPDMHAILASLENEMTELELREDCDEQLTKELLNLRNQLGVAKLLLKTPEVEQAAFIFFMLGESVGVMKGELRHPDNRDAIVDLLQLELADLKRQEPLKLKAAATQGLKKWVQQQAQDKWRLIENQNIRVTEMAEIVWSESCGSFMRICADSSETGLIIKQALPDRASAIVPWLREIAPDSAKKGGRPKKT